ncbi:MAG TPA: P-loop NTPase fold protein, partial [Sphingomicrobium sp.]
KSVGRLPNVIYLLAFDRALAERAVAERFPSEGPSYLEKIVQGALEVPPPLVDALRQSVLQGVTDVMGNPSEEGLTRFMNVFFDAVAPLVTTPRDAVRIRNDLEVSWPAVRGEVDRADFLALSAIKLAKPDLYRAIRSHPEELCDAVRDPMSRTTGLAERYDEMLGLKPSDPDYQRTRTALMRLFPRLESIWSNVFHGLHGESERLICSRRHFPTYFAYSISEDVLPAEQIDELIRRADDIEFMQSYLRSRLLIRRRDGSTQAALALDELTLRVNDVAEEKVEPFITAIFAIADELDVEEDRKRGFSFGNNELRIHWLVNRAVTERFKEAERDAILSAAMETASLAWTCDFARRCHRTFHPDEQGKEREHIVSEAVAYRFRDLALEKLRQAAADHTLANRSSIGPLLFLWEDWSSTEEVRGWTDRELVNDALVITLADATSSVAWSHGMGLNGMGDRVARPSVRVNLKPYAELVDASRLEERVREVSERADLTDQQRQVVQTFLTSPRGSHRRREEGEADGEQAMGEA